MHWKSHKQNLPLWEGVCYWPTETSLYFSLCRRHWNQKNDKVSLSNQFSTQTAVCYNQSFQLCMQSKNKQSVFKWMKIWALFCFLLQWQQTVDAIFLFSLSSCKRSVQFSPSWDYGNKNGANKNMLMPVSKIQPVENVLTSTCGTKNQVHFYSIWQLFFGGWR